MIRRLVLAALVLTGGMARAQSVPIVIRLDDAGPGNGPELLAAAIARPHVVIPPGAGEAVIRRDTTYRETVIILGRDAAVEGTVMGDVIVVGGNLYMRPRGNVSGRAVAIGGGVYESSLAIVGGGVLPFRDFTYDFTQIPGGYALRYRSLVDRPTSAFSLPGLYGFRVPSYDRSNGLSVPFGPLFAVPNTELLIEPRITYRSQLGQIDAMVDARTVVDSRTTIRTRGGRATFSNEMWTRPDLSNSGASLWSGDDARNYFRATWSEARLARQWVSAARTIEPYVGARWERARSARPDSQALGGPWSFRGRHDKDDMLRPNPPIDEGTIASGLVGVAAEWTGDIIVAKAKLDGEVGRFSTATASSADSPRTFAQATFDGTVTFPTFGLQTLRLDGHAVLSGGDNVPRQRWAYVGGGGTIATLDMLERGGDRLIFIDGRYNIPFTRIVLPLVGSPTVTLREVLAGADVGRWPTLAQAMGVRLAVSVAHAEFLFDPVSHRRHFGVGLSLPH